MRFTPDPVQFWASVAPDRPALQRGDSFWTYRRLNEAVQESADALIAQGLGAGEHVSPRVRPRARVQLRDRVSRPSTNRASPVPIGDPFRATTAKRSESAPSWISHSRVSPGRPSADSKRPPPGVSVPPTTEVGPRLLRRLDTPAALCFTLGTSGEPCGCVLTHGNLFWSALSSARNLGVREGDLWLSCLPLHHVGGLSILTRSAYYGDRGAAPRPLRSGAGARRDRPPASRSSSLVPPLLSDSSEPEAACSPRPFAPRSSAEGTAPRSCSRKLPSFA